MNIVCKISLKKHSKPCGPSVSYLLGRQRSGRLWFKPGLGIKQDPISKTASTKRVSRVYQVAENLTSKHRPWVQPPYHQKTKNILQNRAGVEIKIKYHKHHPCKYTVQLFLKIYIIIWPSIQSNCLISSLPPKDSSCPFSV
jgi:hypothetical protein